MKKIEAIIRPNKLEEVKDTLSGKEIKEMTITEVRGMGKQKGPTEIYRGSEYQIDFIPKIKIEIIVPDDKLESAVNAIIDSARTGQTGDGRIFISTVDESIRISAGKFNEHVLV